MSRKVFTAGEVLAAADVNSFLMDQTVMSFPTSAARGSAIPTPTLGMYTHLEDGIPRQEFWNGSAWRSPFGATLVAQSTFTTQSQILFDNIFTTEFDAYQIFVSAVSSTTAGLGYQFRKSGSNISTTTYNHQFIDFQGGASFFQQQLSQTSAPSGNVRTSGRAMDQISIMNPMNASIATNYQISHFDNVYSCGWVFGQNTTTDSFDGLRVFIATGTITGNVSIYGMRK
jgi:hypothetical protein